MTTRRVPPRWGPVLVGVAAVASLAVACGDPDATGPESLATDGSAHPFAVDFSIVPAGYQLTAVGRGTEEQAWSPEMGADEPFTVVEVGGSSVIASIVPWNHQESLLDGASASGDSSPDVFTMDDGRPAEFGEGVEELWDDLVIEVGRTEAIRIAAADATRKALVDMSGHFVSDGDPTVAPVVADPPPEWTVVGSVGADALAALRARTVLRTNSVPGPASGYGMGWVDTGARDHEGPEASLSVVVLPGDGADLAALRSDVPRSGGGDARARELDVGGRPGLLVDGWANAGGRVRSVVTHDSAGALVVVTLHGSVDALSEDEMVALAASVRPATDAEWASSQIEAFGGEELVPDEGEHEIARGTAGGVEWLLQTRTYRIPDGTTGLIGPDEMGTLGPTTVHVDTCLKLSTRTRACAGTSIDGHGGGYYVWSSNRPDFDAVGFPEFIIVTSNEDGAARVRVDSLDTVLEGAMHPVPDGNWDSARTAGVLFGGVPEGALPVCRAGSPEPPSDLPFEMMRIDLFDADGERVGCVGPG